MLGIAIGTNVVTFMSARMARKTDQQKIDAVKDAVNGIRTSVDSLGNKYLKLEKESRNAELLLRIADLVQRIPEKNE